MVSPEVIKICVYHKLNDSNIQFFALGIQFLIFHLLLSLFYSTNSTHNICSYFFFIM